MPKKESTILVEDDETVNRVAVRIPPFWSEDPELWFAQLEEQFMLGAITDDDVKYGYVLSKLEPRQAREIKDVITNPPSSNKYPAIKHALIQRLTDSQEQRIRQLLEREELGDRKPSQFLRHLSTLAGTTVSDDLLRTLWLGRLPPQTSSASSSSNNSGSNNQQPEYADYADGGTHPASSNSHRTTDEHGQRTTERTQPSTKPVKEQTSQQNTSQRGSLLLPPTIRCRSSPMHSAMHVPEKRVGHSLLAANDKSPTHCRLYVTDRNTRTKYLVDTGSDVSVFPQTTMNGRRRPEA
ncbi:uncharacterized protein LOC112637821 [Camponotus floridanus]|uniref:uncharacterized protein LOC112637821 n=1 Tax=Camponotus floridanus TaxID=104421 RepID=UPI000DC6D134|nr:uncharacterized protein LOC112637821 [Camponotus floridanus]